VRRWWVDIDAGFSSTVKDAERQHHGWTVRAEHGLVGVVGCGLEVRDSRRK
jgi:hypothetical protein